MSNELPATMTPARPAPSVVDLLLRPSWFFKNRFFVPKGAAFTALLLLFGICAGFDHFDKLPLHDPKLHWMVIVPSVFLGPIKWYIAEKWFNWRLSLSEIHGVDPTTAKSVFACSELIQVVPYVVVVLMNKLFPATATHPAWSATLFLAVCWSLMLRYRGVRVLTAGSLWKTRFWFSILPFAFHGHQYVRALGWLPY
jgi:hypothetical protein